ncbi:MAG: folylpolyglutamate synthase/dihydrofolate synthase family protein [Salinirussus sp.]
MEYHEAINRLEGLRRLRPKLGTAATADMLDRLGNPEAELTTIQVAGSNGKGSTARILTSILGVSGHAVGLYTSPDLNDLRERIHVGGRPIPKATVCEFVERMEPYLVDKAVDGEAPTFFEVLTVLALWHFDRADVDIAVLEVGIGGRYDATSVVEPTASAVTTVCLEHTDIIGSTVEEIAADKATVAPPNRPLVTGTTGRALATIRDATDVITVGAGAPDGGHPNLVADSPGSRRGSDVRAVETGMISQSQSKLELTGPDWRVETESPLLGAHQAKNAGIAATLARQVADTETNAIAAGIRSANWPGRFEVVETGPLVVLDGAHNPAACRTVSTLLERFEYRDLALVFGAMREKDHREMVAALPSADRVYTAAPTVSRAENAQTLAAVVKRSSDAERRACQSISGALERALSSSEHQDCVLVTGSLYAVSEARDRWTRRIVPAHRAAQTRPAALFEGANLPPEEANRFLDNLGSRTIRLHARRPVAINLREQMRAIGGAAAVSGIEADDRHVRLLLSGTRADFRNFIERLRTYDAQYAPLVRDLETAFETDRARDSGPLDVRIVGHIGLQKDPAGDGHTIAPGAVQRKVETFAEAGIDTIQIDVTPRQKPTDSVASTVESQLVVSILDDLSDVGAEIGLTTSSPSLADAAIEAGAVRIVDPDGLADVSMRRLVAESGVTAVIGSGTRLPGRATGAVEDTLDMLMERILLADRAGIDRSQLVIRSGVPGSASLDRLPELKALDTRICVDLRQWDDPQGDTAELTTPMRAALAADRGADEVAVSHGSSDKWELGALSKGPKWNGSVPSKQEPSGD